MPRKRIRKKTLKSSRRQSSGKGWWEEYKIYIIPSAIGAAVSWFFAGSLGLGIAVFIAVWIGEWIAFSYLNLK